MRWSTQKQADKRKEIFNSKLEWHRKFAWFPINDGDCNWYWLEFVDGRYVLGNSPYWYGHYEYRGRLK
jgi:hypothetical protein